MKFLQILKNETEKKPSKKILSIIAAEDDLTEAQVAYESGKIDAEYIKLDSETAAANAVNGVVESYTRFQVLEPLYETYKLTQQDLNQATALYEKDVQEAQNKIAQLSESVVTLNLEYDNAYRELELKKLEAQNNYTTKSITAKKEYEETMLAYNNASSQNSIDVNGIDSDVDSASETLAEAKETLAEFEEFVGDGVIYAEYGKHHCYDYTRLKCSETCRPYC